MKLYLVRHGQTDFNADGIIQGSSFDIPLNDAGKQQARELAKEIKTRGWKFDVHYCSPMLRAKQTAEIITEGKVNFILDNLLVERGFGEMEGNKVDWSEIGDIFDRRVNYGGYGIEPICNLLARAKAFLDKLVNRYSDDTAILVVAHGALLKSMHFNIVGYDDETDFLTFHFKNCELKAYELPSKIGRK